MSQEIAAGIVLYNPDDMQRVKSCIERVQQEISHVYIFDNSTISHPLDFSGSVTYLSEKRNCGIAYALNQIMAEAKNAGFEWVITMDQDSILPLGMIKSFRERLESAKKDGVAILCPQVIDKRRTYMKAEESEEEVYIDMCITSASCTSVEIWEKVGKFDEWLFIDLVDNEFCKRVTSSGYKILQMKKWVLDQEFGKIIPKSKKTQDFWVKVGRLLNNDNFAKFSYKKKVDPIRVYYTSRNIIYVNRKLVKYGSTAYENYNVNNYLGFVIAFLIPSILRSDKKIVVIKEIFRGIREGKAKEVIVWEAPRIITEE